MVYVFYFGVLIAHLVLTWMYVGPWEASKWLGLSGLAFWAGAGLKGSLYGSWVQIAGGAAMAAVFMGAAIWLSQGLAFVWRDYTVLGWQWAVGTFVFFLVFTSRRFSPVG